MTAFVDTSAILALADRDDRFHGAAADLWIQWTVERPHVVTSNYVVLESIALMQSRLGMESVRSFHRHLLPVLQVEWISPDIHRRAIAALLAADRRRLSLVDCTSFELMRELGLRRVFAFDRHFSERGLTRIP